MNDSSPELRSGHPPHWLERLLEHLQDIGIGPHLVERFVSWWRRYGLVKTLILTMAVLWPVMRFEVLPGATSSVVESRAEAQGLRLKVADWSLSLNEFSAIAHDVTIETGGRYGRPYVLRADAVEIDASLWQNLREGVGRVRRRVANLGRWALGWERVAMPPLPVGRAITIAGGELYLERLMSGRGNWQDAFVRTNSPGADSGSEVDPYYVPVIELKDFKVTYVEHLPADPGSGLEQSLTSTLHLDEATLTLGDFVGPADDRDDPTDFSLDGRVADGRISVTGAFNLWAASFSLDISLNNVGAATLGVMAPETSFVPESGTLTGHILLSVRDEEMRECAVNLNFRDVRYRANPRSPIIRPRLQPIEQDLEDVSVTGLVNGPCRGNWQDPQFRPFRAVQASVTAQALRDAPPGVASAALIDQRRFTDVLSPDNIQAELVKAGDQLTQQIGEKIGEETGNAVSRGLKSVGRGIGRIFGRKPK